MAQPGQGAPTVGNRLPDLAAQSDDQTGSRRLAEDGLAAAARLGGSRLHTSYSLAPLAQLGKELSESELWRDPAILERLERGGISVSALFESVPDFLEIDGRLFRITLVTDGSWPAAEPVTVLLVALDPEIHTNPSLPGQVLVFHQGRSAYLSLEEVAAQPAIVLSLEEVAEDDQPHGLMSHYPARLSLGAPRSPDSPAGGLSVAIGAVHTEVAPGCSANRVICSTGGPAYFYLDELKILEDHETLGSPEIELEVHRLDVIAPGLAVEDPVLGVVAIGCGGGIFSCSHPGGPNHFIFDGGVHADALGRSRTLPDVNSKNFWYTMSPVALFPLTGSFGQHPEYGSDGVTVGSFESSSVSGWSINLIDDDSDKGILHIDMLRKARTLLYLWVAGASAPSTQGNFDERLVDQFALWRLSREPGDIFGNDPGYPATPHLHDYAGLDSFFSNADDPFLKPNDHSKVQGVGVSEALFTSAVCGAGRPASTRFELGAGEFTIRGHFGCPVTHSCGDGKCTTGAESCSSCPGDCGLCPPPGGGGECDNFDYSQCFELQSCQVGCVIGSPGSIGASCCGCFCDGLSECPLCLL